MFYDQYKELSRYFDILLRLSVKWYLPIKKALLRRKYLRYRHHANHTVFIIIVAIRRTKTHLYSTLINEDSLFD